MTDQLDTLQKIEIAEGAEIRLRVAGPAVRSLAFVVDTLVKTAITFAVVMVIVLVTGLTIGGDDADEIGEGFILLALFFIEWGYFVWFEHSEKGATPGKRAFGLRVVRISGAPISLTQAVIRNVLRFVDMLPFTYGIGLASCLMTKSFQRLGDLAAGTLVVYADPKPQAQESDPGGEVTVLHPPNPLSREEQGAIVAFSDRIDDWSEARQEELANLAGPLTKVEGRSSVEKLQRIAQWVRTAG